MLSGLHPTCRTEGIWFHGHPIQLRGQGFKGCRYTVFAEDHAFPYFTFREYLAYVFRSYRKTCPDVTELVQGFHFADFADVLLKDLSTCNRKKAFLITAFALKPELLLLDAVSYTHLDVYKRQGLVCVGLVPDPAGLSPVQTGTNDGPGPWSALFPPARAPSRPGTHPRVSLHLHGDHSLPPPVPMAAGGGARYRQLHPDVYKRQAPTPAGLSW